MLLSTKVTKDLEPGLLRYQAVHHFCIEFMDLKNDIAEFWNEGWEHMLEPQDKCRWSSLAQEVDDLHAKTIDEVTEAYSCLEWIVAEQKTKNLLSGWKSFRFLFIVFQVGFIPTLRWDFQHEN